jgi:hypothetical protein
MWSYDQTARPQLTVSAPGDRYEREADHVAARVLRTPAQQQPAWPEPARPRGSRQGQPLPPDLRAELEPKFGVDFGGVRVHADARADRLSRYLSARAFTTGQDIYFRRGEYHPNSAATRKILAHELTHVVQQNSATAPPDMVQRTIAARPHGGSIADINRHENKPAHTPTLHQGVTSTPVNYVAPDYRVVTRKANKHWAAKVELTRSAYEGDSEALYLAKGTHDSGYLWGGGADYAGAAAHNRLVSPHSAGAHDVDHVYLNVSAGIARGSKLAEQEHLDDYRHAYHLTLEAAEEAIQAVEPRTYGAPTAAIAEREARDDLRQHLEQRSNRNIASADSATWGAAYKKLFTRSSTHRDSPGYHLQTVVENPKWNNPVLKRLSSLKRGHPVHHVDVTPSPTFRLGVPSDEVVDPNH